MKYQYMMKLINIKQISKHILNYFSYKKILFMVLINVYVQYIYIIHIFLANILSTNIHIVINRKYALSFRPIHLEKLILLSIHES